jgi:hypothetical protein
MTLIERMARRYRRWEAHTSQRMRTWSVRRRWTVLVLIPALACGCGGTVIGAPLVWLADATAAAGKGAASPAAAVNVYLMALSYNNDAGLLPIVGDDDGLMDRWRAYRADMQRGGNPPARLDFTLGAATYPERRRSQLDADVQAVWWSTGGTRLTGYRSGTLRWHFALHHDGGWRIDRVTPAARCGGYVPADRCG